MNLTETVHVPVGDRLMDCYLARPADGSAGPGVVVGMELFGVTAHVRDVCERLAELGFVALAPDLFHRQAHHIELAADAGGRAHGFELLAAMTRAEVLADVAAAVDYLRDRSTAVAGMVGLSLGGHLAYLAATALPLPAIAVLYCGWIPTTDISLGQPVPTIASTSEITARVLILVGEDDPLVPPAHRAQLAAALTQAAVEHEIVVYPGVGHGFLCDRRAGYDAPAAVDAWLRIAALLAADEAQLTAG